DDGPADDGAADDGAADDAAADDAAADDGAADDQVDLAQGCDKTFYVITHGDGGNFWSVVEKGVSDAAAAVGCEVIYFGSTNDAQVQSQEIEAAIAAGADGVAISLADPAGVEAAARAVVAAGIPLYTLNSGLDFWKDLGATAHSGQDEIVAGRESGLRFNEAGATKILCGRQEQTNVALDNRCDGLAETFEGEVVSEFVGLDADPTDQEANIAALLGGDPDIDGFMGTGPNVPLRALAAAEAAGRDLVVSGFDLSPDILSAIDAGDVAFTVDQQQYLQGYLPVILMFLEATNLNTAGGGLPVLTGPGFVDASNAAAVAALVEAGTR
ncbi:MAG: substrate-binding domain-containing protein, partial [Acidimicrobiales bacterium]